MMRSIQYRMLCSALLLLSGTSQAHTEVNTSDGPPEFVWAFTLSPDYPADAWRIELTPEIMQRLNRSSADDLMIFDAQNRPVPFARVPASMFSESVALQRPLLSEGSRVAEDQPESAELSLEFEHNGARLRVNAPETESRIESTEALRYEALLALARPDEFFGGSHQENAVEHTEFARLQIEFQTEQRFRLQCWLRDADQDTPATRSANLTIEQETRPLRYGGDFQVPISENAWHLACYGPDELADDLQLIAAEWSRSVQRDYQNYFTLLPELSRTSESPEILEFELPGPYRADQMNLASGQSGVFSRLTLNSRQYPEQRWTRRGEMTLSTLEGSNNRPLMFDSQSSRRDRLWMIQAEPPLGHLPAMEFDVSADTLVFLGQGEPPWQLRVGSYTAVTPRLNPLSLNELSQSLGPIWQWPEIAVSQAQRIGEDSLLQPPTAPIEWSRYLLWLVLVVGSLFVVLMAVRLLRETQGPH